MSELAKRTFVYENLDETERIVIMILPQGALAPKYLELQLSETLTTEHFTIDSNRTDRLNVRQIVAEEKAQDLRNGIMGLMDSLDDSVISNEEERLSMYEALKDLHEKGFN